ncbi:NTF2-like N-terminal transpeptidase domain protein [Clostridioides difficile CD160]|nr:NTF2-like N-terminal transpeptidase domain protein [Clostridioides difficile CD160]
MNITKGITLLLTLSIVISVAGCSQKNASYVAKKYIDRVNSGDYETAYSLLSKDSKKEISLENFEEFQDILVKTNRVVSYKVSKEKNIKKYNYGGKEYKNVVKLEESFEIKNILHKRNDSLKINRYFIVENNKYKLLLHESFKNDFSINSMALAQLTLEDYKLETIKEVETLLKKSISINPTDSDLYYAQACNYMRFDGFPDSSDAVDNAFDSINNALKYLDKIDSEYKKKMSDIYNLKGVILMANKRFDEARQCLNKSLYFNKDNEDPKSNLESLKSHLD